jgi:uncharacterized protein YdhG (YjbR/CyaY superfamily)
MSKRKSASTAPAGPKVRAYLAELPPRARAAAREIRALVRSLAPDAVEHFSYGIPGFRYRDKPLVWYAGWQEHVSIYPFSAAFAAGHGIRLDAYETSKGTVRFPLTKPLPAALIKRLIKARMQDLRRV